MTNPSDFAAPVEPAEVTGTRFTLTPLGRRGYQPDEVDEYLARLAVELTRRDELAESLRTEAARYRDALREWQSQQGQLQTAMADGAEPDAAAQLARAQLLAEEHRAQAKQQAEEQLAQTREYCRQLIEQARTQARRLMEQAHRQAGESGDRPTAEAQAERQRRSARVRSSLDAVTAAEERLREAREQLAAEAEELDPQDLSSTVRTGRLTTTAVHSRSSSSSTSASYSYHSTSLWNPNCASTCA